MSMRPSNELAHGVYAAMVVLLALSESRPAHAGAWTVPQGQLWVKVSYLQQNTDEWYIDALDPELQDEGTFGQFSAGTRRPYYFNGEYDLKAVFIEGVYGVTDWLNFGVKLPFSDQIFHDDNRTDPPSDAGFSDLRIFSKIRVLQKPAIITLKAEAKIPTGDFKNEDGLIPVGEGQWDFDFLLQVGRSLWPLPAYANVDAGYRVRLENEEIFRDPGDEWLLNAEVGYLPTHNLLLALKFEYLKGRVGSLGGFQTDNLKQCIAYLVPTVAHSIHRSTALEAAIRISTEGRNFPAGCQFTLGLSTNVDIAGLIRKGR
ncbi:MAG: transporter [Candidatus Latescibacterota bacterium]|nr:transporter [Candidatus Latescibacterota bacterium]